jgi:transposase
MAHTFRHHNPDQIYLFPPSASDWLSADHCVYVVRDVVSSLDLSKLTSAYSKDGRGAPAFSPSMLLSVVLYGMVHGVYSCRKLAKMCENDIGARLLVGDERPDFRSVNRFRLRHGAAIESLFVQSVHLCQKARIVTLTDVAVDGTKIASFASKKGNITYGKIASEESRHLEFFRRAMERADAEDAAEDALYGEDNAGPPVDERMKSSASRLALLREAKAALEEEERSKAEAKKQEWDDAAPGDRPHAKRPDPENTAPSETAQYNPVDPDSRVQFSCQSGYSQGYNAQVAVDAHSQVIVACDLSNAASDVGFLSRVVSQAIANTSVTPERVLADAGYYSRKNVSDCESRGICALIPPPLKKSERNQTLPTGLEEGEIALLAPKQRMMYLLAQPQIRKLYNRRSASVETVFAQMKGSPGHSRYRRFLRRTLEKCREDWALLCCVHNLSKIITWKRAMMTV